MVLRVGKEVGGTHPFCKKIQRHSELVGGWVEKQALSRYQNNQEDLPVLPSKQLIA